MGEGEEVKSGARYAPLETFYGVGRGRDSFKL